MPGIETAVVFGAEARLALLAADPSAPVFCRPEWVLAAWTHLPSLGRPAALVVRVDGTVVAALPLSVQHARIRSAAAPLGDRHDLVDGALSAAIAQSCLQTLEATLQHVELEALDPGSALCPAAAARPGWTVRPVPSPVLRLPARRSRHAVQRLRRLTRDGAVEHHSVSAPDRCAVEALLAQRAHTWRRTGRYLELPDVERSSAHRTFLGAAVEGLAGRGLARIETLRHGDTVVAQDLYFGPEHRPMLYLRAHDFAARAYSPGAVLLSLCLDRLAAAGVAELDLGRGDENYKFALGADPAHVQTLTYRPPPDGCRRPTSRTVRP